MAISMALATTAPVFARAGPSSRAVLRRAVAARHISVTAKKDGMGEIGLGDEMEDMMKMADGGAVVPKFIADLDIPQLTAAFKFLGSTETSAGELLFVEKYGETMFRQSGWTTTAELINGRVAQIGFVLALLNTFNGDVLSCIAKYPVAVALTAAVISGASLVPTVMPRGYGPESLKESVMSAYDGAGLDKIFTPNAEMINGRASMVGFAFFLLTATIF